MSSTDVKEILRERAELTRRLAALDERLAVALGDAERPEGPEGRPPPPEDRVLGLAEAAAFMGEPPSTFRRRPEYLKALVSRPTERRRRYSRAALDRIKADRLASNVLKADA